jgi:hypothetical protein
MQTPQTSLDALPNWQDRFAAMLPQIEAYARRAFRACHRELQDELVAAVVADCCVAYARLVELGREADAFPTTLAGYAIRRIGAGICVGSSRNQYDVSSRYSQLRTGVQMETLHWRDRDSDWNELLVEDRRSSPADIAALRVDVAAWIGTLSVRDRAIALLLAVGERTCDVAQKFGLTSGRIAQLRRELSDAWWAFHGLDSDGRELEPMAA